jgi:hypothetical protein
MAKKAKPLTPEKKREYVRNRSGNCPYCGGTNFDGGSFDMSGTSVAQHITCLDCKREWDDVYKLVAIDEPGVESNIPDHPEVIVVVHGGVVQGAKSNMADVEVHVLDYDNMDAAKEEPAAKDEYDHLVAVEEQWKSMEYPVL